MRVQNERELGNAVKQEESCIELEGKLASHVKKLMKLNMALWVFSLTTLSVAVLALMQAPATAGVSGIISIVAGTSAASILGMDTVIAAVSINSWHGYRYRCGFYCCCRRRNPYITKTQEISPDL